MNQSNLSTSRFYFSKPKKEYNDNIFSRLSSCDPVIIRSKKKSIFKKIQSLVSEQISLKEFSSEHYDCFNCLSLSGRKIANILEIGSFKGLTAAYLAILFPNSRVHSIDLPASSDEYINTYGRQNSVSDFVEKRTGLLDSFPNITFSDTPSTAFLFSSKQKYDLIWIDGDHSYPQVCIDIIQSLNILEDSGVIMVDDIYRFGKKLPENHLKSVAAFETIENLFASNIITRDYIYKRTTLKRDFKNNLSQLDPLDKSISIITKSFNNG